MFYLLGISFPPFKGLSSFFFFFYLFKPVVIALVVVRRSEEDEFSFPRVMRACYIFFFLPTERVVRHSAHLNIFFFVCFVSGKKNQKSFTLCVCVRSLDFVIFIFFYLVLTRRCCCVCTLQG